MMHKSGKLVSANLLAASTHIEGFEIRQLQSESIH